jgi:Protein kinase domain
MALAPGARLGPYEVTSPLGEGGMGTVWRAHHIALKRDDALKVLPDAFASDPERLARFQREAQVLASLNHPNIAHVYGLEESDGTKALVMELVGGPTLADRIAQGPIPLDDALPIARQIAEALEAAHEQGIIHRDRTGAAVLHTHWWSLASAVSTTVNGLRRRPALPHEQHRGRTDLDDEAGRELGAEALILGPITNRLAVLLRLFGSCVTWQT